MMRMKPSRSTTEYPWYQRSIRCSTIDASWSIRLGTSILHWLRKNEPNSESRKVKSSLTNVFSRLNVWGSWNDGSTTTACGNRHLKFLKQRIGHQTYKRHYHPKFQSHRQISGNSSPIKSQNDDCSFFETQTHFPPTICIPPIFAYPYYVHEVIQPKWSIYKILKLPTQFNTHTYYSMSRNRMRRPNGMPITCQASWCDIRTADHVRRHPITGAYYCNRCGIKIVRDFHRRLAQIEKLKDLIRRGPWIARWLNPQFFPVPKEDPVI